MTPKNEQDQNGLTPQDLEVFRAWNMGLTWKSFPRCGESLRRLKDKGWIEEGVEV